MLYFLKHAQLFNHKLKPIEVIHKVLIINRETANTVFVTNTKKGH